MRARWNTQKRNKFNAKKMEVNGVKFDSKLELYMYKLLKAYNIPFEFQIRKQLQPKFNFYGENIREIYMVIDFVIRPDGTDKVYYVDTKGYATDKAILKYKMLRCKLKEEHGDNIKDGDIEVLFLQNRSECSRFALRLLTEHKIAKQKS